MAEAKKKLVIIASRGIDDERATVAWTLANGGINEGLEVTMFLVSGGVEIVRKGAADIMQMNPADPPLRELISNFMSRGGNVLVCPPCAKLRGYQLENFIDGIEIAGTPALYGLVKQGAATLSL